MNLNNIDSVNTLLTQYNLSNNRAQEKIDLIDYVDYQNKDDYVDFSIDYGNDKVSNILNDINNSFDNSKDISNNKSILDCTTQYGKIIKSINSNGELDNDTKSRLTEALDKSFDCFSEKKVRDFSSDMSVFFNKAYNDKESYDKKGINIEIHGDELLNQDETEKNISNMFSTAKTFYKNNLDGTKEQLDTFLEDKFSKTESINKLSYSDLKSLEKSLDIVDDYNKSLANIPFIESTDRFSNLAQRRSNLAKTRSESMKSGLENLEKEGVSSIVIDGFKNAVNQNENCSKREDTYASIGDSYQKQLEELLNDKKKQQSKLDELKEERKRIIEQYNKQMKKLQEQIKMMSALNTLDGKQDDLTENLTKIHKKQLENLDKRKIEIQSDISSNDKIYKAIGDNYANFINNPSDEIDGCIKKENESEDNINEKENVDKEKTEK